MAELQITGGTVLIDDEDLPLVSGYGGWYIGTNGYVKRQFGTSQNRSCVNMHRLIMGISDKSVIVRHRNGNKLDNRRSNMILTSQSDISGACVKKRTRTGRLGLIGVVQRRRKFIAKITVSGKLMYLGSYDTARQAAETYDVAAVLHWGANAITNASLGRDASKLAEQRHPRKNNASGLTGVSRKRDKWHAQMWADGRCMHIGYFKDKYDAARAYDKAAIEHLGPFAVTNASLGLLPENSLDTAS